MQAPTLDLQTGEANHSSNYSSYYCRSRFNQEATGLGTLPGLGTLNSCYKAHVDIGSSPGASGDMSQHAAPTQGGYIPSKRQLMNGVSIE